MVIFSLRFFKSLKPVLQASRASSPLSLKLGSSLESLPLPAFWCPFAPQAFPRPGRFCLQEACLSPRFLPGELLSRSVVLRSAISTFASSAPLHGARGFSFRATCEPLGFAVDARVVTRITKEAAHRLIPYLPTSLLCFVMLSFCGVKDPSPLAPRVLSPTMC